MSASVSEQFALLLGDSRRHGEKVLTRRSGICTPLGPVLLGVDDDGLRHLLVPVPGEETPKDRVSRGINLGHRDLMFNDIEVRYADLSCTIRRLVGPFDRLVEDVLSRLGGEPNAGLNAVVSTLDDWRALLRRSLEGLSRDEVIGLIGELEIMSELASVDPVKAVLGWTGPSGAVHDFSRNGWDVEVKSTTAVNANTVRISNLDQLDPSLSTSLHLALVHLSSATDAPDIDARIDRLAYAGVPMDALETRLADMGYFRGMELSVPAQYSVREIRWWAVGDDFPGLRASDIEASRLFGVDGVSYELLIGVLPAALTDGAVAEAVGGWAR